MAYCYTSNFLNYFVFYDWSTLGQAATNTNPIFLL